VFLNERNWRVNVEVLIVESTATHPLPITIVDGPIGVNQEFVENLSTKLPVHPKITSCKEACYNLPGLIVDPSFFLELPHGSINCWEACLSIFPKLKSLLISAPFYLSRSWISNHFPKLLTVITSKVIPLSEIDLTNRLSTWAINFLNLLIEGSSTNATKLEIWTQTCCLIIQSCWPCNSQINFVNLFLFRTKLIHEF